MQTVFTKRKDVHGESWKRGKKNFMVKTLQLEHTCRISCKLRRMTTSWIATKYETNSRLMPTLNSMTSLRQCGLNGISKSTSSCPTKQVRKVNH